MKNKGAMLAKGFFLGVQFEEAFRDGLYFELAKKTNLAADYLKEGLKGLGLRLAYPAPTNQVFLPLPAPVADSLIARYGAETWEKRGEEKVIRLVTDFKTGKEDVDELIRFLRGRLGGYGANRLSDDGGSLA